jgi:hypothetical protein
LGDLRERENLEDLGIGGRIILRWIFSKWNEDMDWILSQDRDRWRAVVTAVMNLRVTYNVGNFLTGLETVSGLWSKYIYLAHFL